MHEGEKIVVILLLCPSVTEALQQMHNFGRDFINSTVCFKKNKNKTRNPKHSLPLVLRFFIPALLQRVPGPFQLWSPSRPRGMEGGSVGSSSAAFPCTTFSTCQTWHTLRLICSCKARQGSAFGVPYLSESRTMGANSAACFCKYRSRSVWRILSVLQLAFLSWYFFFL